MQKSWKEFRTDHKQSKRDPKLLPLTFLALFLHKEGCHQEDGVPIDDIVAALSP